MTTGTYCQRVLDTSSEGLACARQATEVIVLFDRALNIRVEANVCAKHYSEFSQRSAKMRTARQNKTTTPINN